MQIERIRQGSTSVKWSEDSLRSELIRLHLALCVRAVRQWCHGAPGLAFACIKAYELWRDAKYLQVARESAEVVWQRGLLKKGATIGPTGGTAKEGCAALLLSCLADQQLNDVRLRICPRVLLFFCQASVYVTASAATATCFCVCGT